MGQRNERIHEKARSCNHAPRKLLAAALALALGTLAGGAQAATQVVTNCNDHGSGSLRAAITAAMSGDVVDATGLTCSTISLNTGALAVTVNDLKVRGAGRDHLTVSNGVKYGRVFRHEGTGVLNLYGMTITSGAVSPIADEAGTQGGCIYSNGTVNLGNQFDPTDRTSGVAVSDCMAVSTHAGVRAQGGGIFARKGVALANSTVTLGRAIAQDPATDSSGGGVFVSTGPFAMKYSEVRDCSASGPSGFGGGIDAEFADTVTVTHSTIAGNTATGRGGGAYLNTHASGPILIDNSTISGNISAGDAGAIFNVLNNSPLGAIHIYSTTITANQSTSTNVTVTGGAAVLGPTILKSTIASGNIRGGASADLVLSAGITGADNLIGISRFAPPPAGLIIATDPKLGPLTNRGGSTRTHEPLANSPAIDHGNNSFSSTTDQRGPGYPRTLGAGTDIGAVERNPDTIFANGFD